MARSTWICTAAMRRPSSTSVLGSCCLHSINGGIFSSTLISRVNNRRGRVSNLAVIFDI